MKKKVSIKKKISELDYIGKTELETKFQQYYGFPPPKSNVRNLRMRLAWKIQETYIGGISNEDMQLIEEIANNDPIANLKNDSKKTQTLQGVRYEKTWNGKVYQVIVLGNNKFEFNGEKYRSLSAIASKITGTHWNGKKFFGVK